jgi:membrane-associated phospholipid phosphatase
VPASRIAAMILLGLGLTGLAAVARADDQIPDHPIDRPRTALITAGVFGAAFVLSQIPIHPPNTLWRHELFGALDDTVHDKFSTRAVTISNGAIVAAIAAPVAYLTGTALDAADADRLLIYAEAIAINLVAFETAKLIVQRPRPYLYGHSAEAVQYAASQGEDAHLSFYSGHASTAFCAATTGAYLVAASSHNPTASALTWGGGFALAAATADLRIRAGKHFYSDVVTGGAVGIAIGYAVPALHASGRRYVPSLTDVASAAAGLVGGALIGQLIPLGGSADSASPNQPAGRNRPPSLAANPAYQPTIIAIGGAF